MIFTAVSGLAVFPWVIFTAVSGLAVFLWVIFTAVSGLAVFYWVIFTAVFGLLIQCEMFPTAWQWPARLLNVTLTVRMSPVNSYSLQHAGCHTPTRGLIAYSG